MIKSTKRGRASLLATSMFATSLLAGAGGLMGAATVAPGVAVAGVCNTSAGGLPAASGTQPNTAGAANVTPSPTEFCEGGFNGLGYATNTGSLAVTLEPVAAGPGGGSSVGPTHGVFLADISGTVGDLSFIVNTTTAPSGAIIDTTGQPGILVENFSGGNVTVDTGNSQNWAGAQVTSTKGIGIEGFAVLGGNVNINVAGNVSAFNTGILAVTNTGNISIITQHGDDVNSTNGDGIDAFSTSGNIFVHLLDGSINSNTSACGGASASSGISTPSAVSGVVSPPPSPSGGVCSDPNGMHLTTGGAGTINVITDDDVHNLGAGVGILATTFNGNNTIQVDANLTNTLGDGLNVTSTGTGAPLVILSGNATTGTVYNTTTTGTGVAGNGFGVLVEQTGAVGNQTATILSVQPGNVTTTGGNSIAGLEAEVTGPGAGSVANITMTGPSGGTISVEGGSFNKGIFASDASGTALVTTNTGRHVSVGTKGGNVDVGVASLGFFNATVTLGDSNTIVVGNASSFNEVGVEAAGNFSANVVGGNGESITVTADSNAIAVAAVNTTSGNATVTFGNTAKGATGITAHGNVTGPLDAIGVIVGASGPGNATATIGSTAITVTGGDGVVGLAMLGNVTLST